MLLTPGTFASASWNYMATSIDLRGERGFILFSVTKFFSSVVLCILLIGK